MTPRAAVYRVLEVAYMAAMSLRRMTHQTCCGTFIVRSEFIVYKRHYLKHDIPAQMWLKFWILLIPAGSTSFLLSVTWALVMIL